VALIRKEFTFEAAHILPNHAGKCSRLHGHSYKVEVFVEGEISPVREQSNDGMVMDFGSLTEAVQMNVLDHLDHRYLNEFPAFAEGQMYHPPSAENIALFIYHVLCTTIRDPKAELRDLGEVTEASPVRAVRVWEGYKAYAEVGEPG
jgi:6-pyruvoyltetrahydropterin/6-carboxytetrahydropterin synthase